MERNFKIPQDGLHFQLLFYEPNSFEGMRLKSKGALIPCIVAVLAKTYLEKFTPKVRRTSYNLLPVKSLVCHISQTIRSIEKHFFLLEVQLMYIFILRKSQFRNFDPFQRER